jgi:hypothetical protein
MYCRGGLTVGKESIGISMVKVLRGTQALDTRISIAATLVGGALDLRQMSSLMEGGGGLVLGMASLGESAQGSEVEVAVDHVAGAGQSIGQHTGATGAIYVGAVLLGDTGCG